MCFRSILAGLIVSIVALAATGQGMVTVEVEEFGLRMYRPGGIVPVRLKLTSSSPDPLPVWVQWQVANGDGDIQEVGRSLTLTPNQPSYPWLYAALPWDMMPNSAAWTVRVFEERDGERQGEVGGARINASAGQAVEPASSMMLVVGDRHMNLDEYAATGGFRITRPVGAHEDTRVAFGVRPGELCDRWDGLFPFEAIGWVGDNTPPQDLGIDQANALRQYVYRGGHLIISLPSATNPWGLGARGQTQLEDLLPCRSEGQQPRRDESVPLSALLPAISKFNSVSTVIGSRREPEFTIQVFKQLSRSDPKGAFNVIDNGYEPLISLPDGRVIAIQRLYGKGRITVVGLDFGDGRYASAGLPQADVFWNRVLGRRADTPTGQELALIEKAERLSRPDFNVRENSMGMGALFTGPIAMSEDAGLGLLLAFVLFVIYWLIAGPVGFGVLKHFGHVRHSWLAFAACSALFTAIAWGSVSLVPKQIRSSHVTYLDHVVQLPTDSPPLSPVPQLQHAVSHLSMYLPGYGATPVSVVSEDEQRDLLLQWTPPGDVSPPFPNVDRYRVDTARSSTRFSLPARATASQLYVNWAGPVDEKWGGRLREEHNAPIQVVPDAAGNEMSLRGLIWNDLPGPLTDVTIIWVQNQRVSPRRYALDPTGAEQPWVGEGSTGNIAMLNRTDMWRVGSWDTGVALDLAAQTKGRAPFRMQVQERYIRPYAGRDLATVTNQVSDVDRRRFMEMLCFYSQLNPPSYLKSPGSPEEEQVVFQRHLGRELDLSSWFNRPCLIIMGFLEQSANPVPLRIEGDPVSNNSGLTMVRWIYPLPLNESIAFSDTFARMAADSPSPVEPEFPSP